MRFDIESFASQLKKTTAGYVFLTINYGTEYLLAPGACFVRIYSCTPGTRIPTYDFIHHLHAALSEANIDLYLTYDLCNETGGGFENNLMFIEDACRRYKTKIKGWYFKNCFYTKGFGEGDLKRLSESCHYYNSNAIMACDVYGINDENGKPLRHIRRGAKFDDYTSGELTELKDLPYSPFIGQPACRWHIRSCVTVDGKVKYDGKYLNSYINKVNALGGAATLDIDVDVGGNISSDILREIICIKRG